MKKNTGLVVLSGILFVLLLVFVVPTALGYSFALVTWPPGRFVGNDEIGSTIVGHHPGFVMKHGRTLFFCYKRGVLVP